MTSILDNPKERVKLLKSGFTGTESEHITTHILDNNITIVRVNWQD